ncbi:MAG TPA: fibronectin type III domain-containing protein [Prolixibacteraceae bacterium]|nr:fibronectin type III domain-containing protein [Prolixibacteraceae bacterium]
MKNVYKIAFSTLALMAAMFAGCEKEEDLGSPDRLFRPIFNNITVGGNWIRVEWEQYDDVDTYALEISAAADSFATLIKTAEVTGNEYTFEGLVYDSKYLIRIKSLTSELESRYYLSDIITTADYPTKLLSPEGNDIIDVAVKLRWIISETVYDSIQVIRSSTDSLVATVIITPEKYAAGQIIVTGLGSNTVYKAKAYAGGEYQGKVSFRTAEKQVFEGDYVDLRGLNESQAFNAISPALFDTIPDGTKIILAGGVTYNMGSTITVTKGFHFVTGLSFYGMAIVSVDKNFDLSGTTTTDVSFTDIFFTEGASVKRNADGNYGGTYIFNVSNPNSSAVSISLENCIVKYKRGVFRIKTDNVVIESISYNNCQFDSIAGYGLVNVDAASTVKNISVTNSTISHAQKLLVNVKGTENETVTFNDNTVYSSPNDAIYVLDFKERAVGNIYLKNNIFGPGYGTTNGIRSSAVNITIDNNFITSDLRWTMNEGTGLPNAAIDPVETTVSSSELFADPNNFDFTLQVEIKAGDPRWRN